MPHAKRDEMPGIFQQGPVPKKMILSMIQTSRNDNSQKKECRFSRTRCPVGILEIGGLPGLEHLFINAHFLQMPCEFCLIPAWMLLLQHMTHMFREVTIEFICFLRHYKDEKMLRAVCKIHNGERRWLLCVYTTYLLSGTDRPRRPRGLAEKNRRTLLPVGNSSKS